MSSVQCRFCSSVNLADAKYCNSCFGQLNLAPCPHCDGVNEVTAVICHACKGQLVQAAFGAASDAEQNSATEAVASRRQSEGLALPPKYGESDVESHRADLSSDAPEPGGEAHGLPRRNPKRFTRPRLAAAMGAGLILVIGILLYGMTRGPAHPPSPVLNAAPREGATTTGTAVGTAVARGSESVAACSAGAISLGLCPSEPVQAQPATQINSSDDVRGELAKEPVTTACSEAAAALGLCTK